MKLTSKRYSGDPCVACGNRIRYKSDDSCVECVAERVRRQRRGGRGDPQSKVPERRLPKRELPPARPHVIQSDFIAAPSRARLMAGK